MKKCHTARRILGTKLRTWHNKQRSCSHESRTVDVRRIAAVGCRLIEFSVGRHLRSQRLSRQVAAIKEAGNRALIRNIASRHSRGSVHNFTFAIAWRKSRSYIDLR